MGCVVKVKVWVWSVVLEFVWATQLFVDYSWFQLMLQDKKKNIKKFTLFKKLKKH